MYLYTYRLFWLLENEYLIELRGVGEKVTLRVSLRPKMGALI